MYIYAIVLLIVKMIVYLYEYALQTIKSTMYECVLYFTHVI